MKAGEWRTTKDLEGISCDVKEAVLWSPPEATQEKPEKIPRIAGVGRDTDHTSAEYKSKRLPRQ
jgi:hypothetical protein